MRSNVVVITNACILSIVAVAFCFHPPPSAVVRQNWEWIGAVFAVGFVSFAIASLGYRMKGENWKALGYAYSAVLFAALLLLVRFHST